MDKCPFCRQKIDSRATVCPHCTKDLSFQKNPGCMFPVLGMATAGFGILLIWIPIVGIPLILIGLLFILIGCGAGITKIIRFFWPEKK